MDTNMDKNMDTIVVSHVNVWNWTVIVYNNAGEQVGPALYFNHYGDALAEAHYIAKNAKARYFDVFQKGDRWATSVEANWVSGLKC